ncbi:MAG: ankyrin repeat protein [Akkermansiaceae bacterium]|jgi:ankyrin repeat protein
MLPSGMMKTFLILMWATISMAAGQTSKELLRDGLFAEESEGDLKTATEKYEALLKAFEVERKVAAVALFRLASIKRKQGDEKATLTLYEDFAKKFGDVEPQATLVKENYRALAGKDLRNGALAETDEERKLAELKKLETTSPDLIATGDDFGWAASSGWSRVIKFYLDKGLNPNTGGALYRAVTDGNLIVTAQLLDAGADPNHRLNTHPLDRAIRDEFWEIAELLVQKGAKSQSLVNFLVQERAGELTLERVKFLVSLGSDPNYISSNWHFKNTLNPTGIPLLDAVARNDHRYVNTLMQAGAKVDLSRETDQMRALHIAAHLGDEEMMRLLIDAGADLDALSIVPKDYAIRIKGNDLPQIPLAPIDLLPDEKISFLLNAGAKVTPRSLIHAIRSKNLELVAKMIATGIDPNLKIEGQFLPLDLAFYQNDEPMIKLLRENGADFEKITWQNLNIVQRQEYARTYLYPNLSSDKGIHLSVPKFDSVSKAIIPFSLADTTAGTLLSLKMPSRQVSRHEDQPVDPDQLTWILIRGGKEEVLDLKTKLPELTSGDVIEITGFHKFEFTPNENLNWKPMSSYTYSKTTQNLWKAQRFPVKLTFEGKTWDLMICPDLIAYDARDLKIPSSELGTLLSLIWTDPVPYKSAIPRSITVQRKGSPHLVSDSSSGGTDLAGLKLLPGDHIVIKENPETTLAEAQLARRKSSITAQLPDQLGRWRWHFAKNESEISLAPTLLDIIAHLNSSYTSTSEGSHFNPINDAKRIGALKILPALDLSKTIIRRLTREGENVIELDLQKKIDEWDRNERREEPFDLKLEAGDLIILSVKPGSWTGQNEVTRAYFEKALTFEIFARSGTGIPEVQQVTYQNPTWLETPFGLLSYVQPSKSPRSVAVHSVKRNGVEIQRTIGFIYWPKKGDLVTTNENRYDPRQRK